MNANHVSRRNLTDLYRKGVRKLAAGVSDDTTLAAALSLAADYLDKAVQRLQELEWQQLEQIELEASLREEGR